MSYFATSGTHTDRKQTPTASRSGSILLATMVWLATIAATLFSTDPASAMKIQEITSKGGIKAWLVEEHAVPLIAMRFAFEGGNAQDPDGKSGTAHFLTGMMDEGAGDLDSQAFQRRMEEIAMRMSFEDSKDYLYGSFETLTENRKDAIALLKMVVNKPRFDADAVERVRSQIVAGLAYAARDPNRVATEQWFSTAFPGHPYGRAANGTAETLASVKGEDLEAYRRKIFAKDTLRVVVVGDIKAADLGVILDDVFGDLPAKAQLASVAQIAPTPSRLKIVEMAVPQSVAQFGGNSLPRKDKDFMAAFVLNHLLGGGGFSSRLMQEVREKRGLAYSAYSYLQPLRHASIYIGGVATKNEEMGQSLDVIRAELKRLVDTGPTQEELDNAKSYLTGSFALRFDTNAKIANQLLYFYQEDFGIDYVEKRNAEVNAVTLNDVKRVGKTLFKDEPFVIVVGKPKGLVSGG
jgi:zinc protease